MVCSSAAARLAIPEHIARTTTFVAEVARVVRTEARLRYPMVCACATARRVTLERTASTTTRAVMASVQLSSQLHALRQRLQRKSFSTFWETKAPMQTL
jgi:hypothetical protein